MATTTNTVSLRVVQPGTEEKSGCLWCPMLAMSADFHEHFTETYQRDADKIINALKEPHEVHTRNVSEPWTEVDILYVGEGPGEQEDRQGHPFVGPLGKFLRKTINELIDTASIKIGFANIIRCLSYQSGVYLPDGSCRMIGDLVGESYRGEVLSYDEKSGLFVSRRVLATHKSPVGERQWLKVTYEGAKRGGGNGTVGVICTDDHEFLTPEGYVQAWDLDGKLINVGSSGLGIRALNTAVGSLLGDATIPANVALLAWSHCAAQREWLQCKAGVFGALVSEPRDRNDGKGTAYVRAHTAAMRHIAWLRKEFYPAGKKIVPRWLPGTFNEQMLACWFLDDGYLRVREGGREPISEFATNGFDDSDRAVLIWCLAKLRITAYIDGPRIRCDVDGTRRLVSLIAAYVPPSMRYKVNDAASLDVYEPSLWEPEAPVPFYARAIVRPLKRDDKRNRSKVSYCLSVEGTENFVTPAGVVHNCRPPLNRDPNNTEKQCCTPELYREILARKPKVIVPLGNHSLEYFTGRTGILAVYGNVMRCRVSGLEHVKIVPVVHPGYVVRADHETQKFRDAIQLGGRVVIGDYEERQAEGEYFVVDEVETVEALMEAIRADKALLAFDTETGASTPHQDKFPRLLCLSFSNQEGVGYTIPLDHPESPWTLNSPNLSQIPAEVIADRPRRGTKKFKVWAEQNEEARQLEFAKRVEAFDKRLPLAKSERARVIEAVRGVFEDPEVPKVGQNEKFDRQHIKYTIGCDIAGVVRDTMLTHLTISDTRGTHGLEVLSYAYTGMGGYHKPLDNYVEEHPECDPAKKDGSYANIPGYPREPGGVSLFEYAGQDTDATLRVYNKLIEDPQYKAKVRLRSLAEHFFPRLSKTLADIEYNGALIDMGVIREMEVELTGKMKACIAKMDALPQVRSFVADKLRAGRHGKRKADPFVFNPGSDVQVGQILFEYYGCQPTELTDGGWAVLDARWKRLRVDNPDIEPGDVIAQAIERKQWEHFSTKADVLEEYANQGVDFASLVIDFRESQKLYGTYVKPVSERLDALGRVHGTFSPIGTVTGRLSSYDPNLQNIPPYAKRAYVSRFGEEGVILSADYSQIELRIAACLYNDHELIKAYIEGADLHTLTAISISGLTVKQYAALPSKQRKEWRVRAKRVNFGIVYGIGAVGLVNVLKKDHVFITVEDAKAMLEKFFKAHPALVAALNVLKESVRKLGYLESFTGRVRRLPEVFNSNEEIVARAFRQAGNFPVQSGAGDITLMALVLIHEWMLAEKLRSCIILTVHDSIVFDCHVDEVLLVAAKAKEIMESIPQLSEGILPGLDWKWLRVPIVAEFDVGVSWGQSVEFDPDVIVNETALDKSKWSAELAEAEQDADALYYFGPDGDLKHRPPESVDELWELMTQKLNEKKAA